ncbi:lonely Cys domain-containing protein [Streptomyces sp. SID4937]|nr:lonely Cys domain-containing protein [Streptomyces sp. SID4937]
MLRDPAVATRLLERGARVLVVPRNEALTTLGPFRDLAGRELSTTDRRTWDTARGLGRLNTGITEENLLGETTGVPGALGYADGYSTTTHEFAHAIHRYGLSDADRQTIAAAYRDKLSPPAGQDPADVEWPDGPRRSAEDGQPVDNYASTDEFEYFAQAVNAYLGTNTGHDPFTGRPRNNGPSWVRENEPALLPLLERLFGTTPDQDGPGPANPVRAVRAENEMYEGFRAVWDRAEGVHRAQPHPPVPAPSQVRHPAPHPATDHSGEAPLPPPPGDPRSGWAEFPADLTAELDRLLTGNPEAEALSQFRFTEESDSDGDSVESDPADDPRTWAGLLFGPASRDEYEVEALLDTARAVRDLADRGTTPGEAATDVLAGLRELTRQVLGLDDQAQVGARDLMLLGSLALSADPGQLADADELARLLTYQDSALGERTRLGPGHGAGRDWTGTGGRTPPLDTYAAQDEDGTPAVWPAPWTDAYVVLAQSAVDAVDAVRLHTPDGVLRIEDTAELARLIARDPYRPAGDDIVLAFAHGDIETVARQVADLTGSRVWYSELGPRVATDWRTGAEHLMTGQAPDGGAHAWMSLRPGQGPVPGGRATGTPAADPHPSDGTASDIEARRAHPLTTREYGFADGHGDGELFRNPGDLENTWTAPRSLAADTDAPSLLLAEQTWDVERADGHPAVRISADRTLAVQNEHGSQQAYATRKAVADSNAKLTRAGLAVRLGLDEERSILLPTPDGGSNRLFRVTPVFTNRSGESTEEVCRDFAIMLAGDGRPSHLVFRDPEDGSTVTAPANASDGAEVTGTHHLAEALGQVADGILRPGSADPGWAAALVRRDERPTGGDGTGPLPAAAYGSALSLERPHDPRRTAMTEAARRIGVNEFAWADVGEGYLVQSVAAPGEDGPSLETNYAKPSSEPGESYFGYHFITVVLASEDGTHQVSLENHARASSREDRLRGMVRANLRAVDLKELRGQADVLRREIARLEESGDDGHLKEVRGHLDLTILLTRAKLAQQEVLDAPAGSPERAEAQRSFNGVVTAASRHLERLESTVPGKRLWYMRMFTRRPGESAHDVNASLLEDGAAEANPLTVVVLHGQEERPQTLYFEPGTERTPDGALNAIRHVAARVARTGLWNSANHLPLPRVDLVGGRTARLGRDIGRARANAVAATFRQELAAALRTLQDGTPGPHLSADRFTVEADSVRVEKNSARGDTVEITVDDGRGGPRRVALRGLRGGSPDDGLDPLAEQWPIGRPVTLMRPRFGGLPPAPALPAAGAPDGGPATGKGKEPEPSPRHWFPYTRHTEFRAEPLRYEVADTGHLRLPDGQEIPPTGWTRFGDDFVHAATGALLRGDNGWLGRVANLDTLVPALTGLDPDAAPYRITADASYLHLVPESGAGTGTSLSVPLTLDPAAGEVGPSRTASTTGMAGPSASGPTAEQGAAWEAHGRALHELGAAVTRAVETGRTGPEGRSEVDAARAAVERAEERLWALGVAPEALADARTVDPGAPATAPDSATAPRGPVPAVPLDAEQRRWIADRVTEADLPPVPEAPDGAETVTSADLRAAGVTLPPGLHAEMALLGDRLPAGRLSASDLARVRLTRPGDTGGTADTVAARVTRRLWDAAYTEVRDAAPEGRDDTETARAWSAAVALVLPPEPPPVLADARYAGEAFRDAVRRVAGHLLAAEGGAEGVRASAAELADTLRTGLGLAPRWTVPATEPAAGPTAGRATGEAAPGRPALQSDPGGQLPDLDMPDLDPGQGQGQFPDVDMDLDMGTGLGELGLPSALDGLDLDALDALWDVGDLGELPDFDFTFGLPAPVPIDVGTGTGRPVYAVPAAPPARPLTTLPALTLVPFVPQSTVTADSAEGGMEGLAHQVARTALRNRRHRVPLPRIDIAGYGADARGAGTARDRDQAAQAQGDLRARAARDLFVRQLDHALHTLQAGLPAGFTPLRPQDFTITARGRSRVPGQGVTADLAGQIGRGELGRQATIGVTSPRHAAALDALDALRRTDRDLRSGPLDVDAVARRIWHLGPSVFVDPEMRRDLFTLTGRAIAAGRATSLAALTAFHLEEQGLLADDRARHVSAGGNRVPGLNWTGADTAGIDALFVDRLTTGPTGTPAPTGNADIAPWPWDTTPYAVLAEGSHDRVTAQLPDGTTWELDADEFAELVAADLARHPLPERAPIVLAVPSAGDRYLDLPRKLAERTGRTVWVHSGLAQRNPDPTATNTIAVLHRDGLPDGTWLPVRPGLAPDPDDDAPAWHREVLTQPIVSSRTGEQTGRSFHEPAELVGERESYRDLDRMSFYVHWDAATNTYSDKRPMPDPGPADKAYRLAGHGLPGGLSLPLADGGSRTVDRDEATGWLRRRKSLVSLPQDHWVDLVICHSGAPGEGSAQDVSQLDGALPAAFTADPLGDDALSLGQHLANQLRRTTRLSYSSQGVVRFGDGPVRVLATDAQGRPWWWETSRPEPDDAELDRLAEQAGFQGEPSPHVRSELLRVVRALKLVMGPDVVVADDFPALVAGAAAVVNMWFADPDLQPAGPFWPQLLSRVIAAHPLAAGGVDGDITRQVLADAAKAWRDSGAALPVSSFVPLPQLRTAASWLSDPAAVDRAAVDALRLADPADAPAHRTRMFWARVRAEETLPGPGPAADALTVRALRLDPAIQLDDALRDRARALLTQGFAAGRNMADPDVVGAYAVEAAGALAAPALLTTVGAAFGSGRDWRGLANLLPRLDSFRVADTTVDAPWAGQDAAGKDRPVPYAVRASVDLEDSGHVQVTLGADSYRLTAAEFAELLAADADLRGLPPATPVLLLLDGLSGPSPAVAETVSRRLGRPVWWSTSPVELSAPDAAEGELPVLATDFFTMNQPSATDWRFTAPATPDLGVPTVPATPAPGPGAPTPATNSDLAAAPARSGDPSAEPLRGGATAVAPARGGDPSAESLRNSAPFTAPAQISDPSADSPRNSNTATGPTRNSDPFTGPARDGAATDSPRNPRSSVGGDPMEGVESTSVPTAPALPATVKALQPLPPRTLVAYGRDETSPSAQGDRTLELLAAQVAATGLRNRRAGAALPRVEVTGYGAEVGPDRAPTGSPGRRRAFTARQRFTRLLASELERLQRELPVGEPRLTAEDFPIVVRAMARVPADWVGTGALAQVSRAEMGRQAVIALRLPPDAAAVQRLDSLRRRDRALRTRHLDVDAIARRVLHLDPGATVQQDDRQELFGLVGRATAAGRATGFAALAAYHLSELGVTAPGRAHHFTVGGSRVPGLNWGADDVIALDTTRSDLLEEDPAGGYDVVSTSPAPWSATTTPYVVAAEGGHDRVEARLPDGSVRELGVEEFVELVAADLAREALPPDTPIVLAVPFAADGYLDLPRRLADRTGRTVWAHSGRITVESAPGDPSTIDVVRTPKTPRGDWIASEPGLGPDTDDDGPDWHHDVVTRALVSALSGRQIGRASHHPAEFARDFEEHDRHLDRMATFVHDHPATGRTSGEYDLPRPGPEDRAYRLDLHGSPGSLTLALRDGTTRDVDEREAGPWLRRRKSLTTLPEDHWVDLVVCWSGAPGDSAVPRPSTASDAYGGPFVADPLATVSMGQHVANATGRAVRIAYGLQGTRRSNGRYQRTLFADAQGRHRAWALARPEPDEDELDRLAEVAGVSPGDGEVSDEMRTATLRLVRALRFTLGHDIDDDPDFDDLLRGAAAVDQMWRSDSDFQEAGPFTLDLLHRVVAAHPEAAAGVDGQTARRVLAAAAEQWARYPGDGLVSFVDLPAVEAAAQWLAEGDVEDEAAAVLRLRTDEVGEAEMSRMFWARVKAEETLPGTGPDAREFAARVLHREPDPSTAHARRAEALDVLTRAFAVGREASDPDVAAAYALKEAGAYDDTALDTVQGASHGTGRDYTDGLAQDVDLARFRTPSGLVDAPWAQGKDRPVPYLVRVGADADDPDLVEVSWGGDTYETTVDEFAELLAADLELVPAELTVPIVLALPGPAADTADLADRIARRLGRTVWWTGFPVDLSGTGDTGDAVLTLHRTADGTTPGPAPWQRARPAHPASAEDAPRPVSAPLPRSTRSDEERTGPTGRTGSPAPAP